MSRPAIVTIIAAILLVIFAIQNAAPATLNLFFWNFSISLALMLIIIFILGAGFGYFFHVAVSLRKKRIAEEKKNLTNSPSSFI